MNETFDTEAILQEILNILRKHNIPVETAELNISMLDAAFDEHIPQLKTYKAGYFHKSSVVDNVPILFHAQRRYPFGDIVHSLEEQILPEAQAFAETLRKDFPRLIVAIEVTPVGGTSVTIDKEFYRIHLNCRYTANPYVNYTVLSLNIILRQLYATSYPTLEAHVEWWVDREPGDSWGGEVIYNGLFPDKDEFTPSRLSQLKNALPALFTRFREVIPDIQREIR